MSGPLDESIEAHLPGALRTPGVAAAVLGVAPAWVWDVAEGRILLSSVAGLGFFGESDVASLAARRFDMNRPGLNQLARLGRSLPRDGRGRLSLLRFFVGLRDISLPCQCSLLADLGNEIVLVVAGSGGTTDAGIGDRFTTLFSASSEPLVLRGAAGEICRNAAAADLTDDTEGAETVDVELPEGRFTLVLAPETHEDESGVDGAVTEETGAAGAEKDLESSDDLNGRPHLEPADTSGPVEFPEPIKAGLPAGGPAPGSQRRMVPEMRRFTFQLDPDGRFVEVGAGFAALVGPKAAEVIGRTWQDLDAEMRLDRVGKLSRALETRDTWSDIQIAWPTDFGEVAQLRLSALPRFGEGRAFAGFRGFADVLAVTPIAEPDVTVENAVEPASEDAVDPAEGALEEPGDASEDTAGTLTPISGPEPAGAPAAEPEDEGAVPDVSDAERPGETIEEDAEVAAGTAETEAEADNLGSRVFQLHPFKPASVEEGALNDRERGAFKAIAEALGARWAGQSELDTVPESRTEPPESEPETPVADAVDEARQPAAPELRKKPALAKTTGPAKVAEPEERAGPGLVFEVMDRIPLGLAVLRDNKVLAANRAFLELFGFPDVGDLEFAGGIGALLEGRGSDDEPGTAVTARRRDGSPILVEARLGRTPWTDGPAMLMSVRSAEPVIGEEEDGEGADALSPVELRAVLDAAFDGVFVLDADGEIVSVNAGGARLLEREADALVARPFTDLVAEDDRSAVADLLRGLLEGSVPSVLEQGREISVLGADGAIPVQLSLGPLDTGEEWRICAVLRDLSEWTEAKADLVAARKRAEAASDQKSDFLAKMSHEIRTPLNGIIGFSEVILEERFGPLSNDRYREYMKDIRESGELLMSLVNDLLDLSKVEAGKLEMSFTGVRLNDLVEQSVAVMQPQSSRARVIIRTSLGRGVPAVVADTRSIRQVLLNILSNAIKFTPPGGQVIVSTALGDTGEVFLRIRDTGVGMSETDVATAMEPFRQLPVTPSTGERGTGLGLPLAKALTEANRANFSLQSKAGEGTLVEISFPQQRVLAE